MISEKPYFYIKIFQMITFQQVCLRYGERNLFDTISFQINALDRVGLVGKNGAGKSTILKVIVGHTEVDSGQVIVPRDITLGYLPQELVYTDSQDVLSETLKAFTDLRKLEAEINDLNNQLAECTNYELPDYLELAQRIAEKSERLHILNAASAEANAVKTLTGLGFRNSDLARQTSEFSGGWRMRIELAKILLCAPDIFLLDEPTNHLDIESIQWLENFLAQYHGAVLLISHDRTFLDKVISRTLEITIGKIHDYAVSYSKYVILRKERHEQQLAAFRNQQKQIEDTKEFIERFRYKATKAIQVQSRIKYLEKLEIIEIEEDDLSAIHLKFPPAPRSGTVVIKTVNLSKKYGDLEVLNKIELVVERGEKIAFVGRNGEGKTTLSRIIIGELDYTGECKLGHNVGIGYYAQNQDELLDPDATAFETIDRAAVGEIRTKMRDILGAFLFSGDDIDKKVKVLSGGEKSRLALARLLLEPYNLLVLDEPTNHLDMRSKDILKLALLQFDGTLIVVSHDREFLDGLTNKIYEFRNKKIHEYRGNIFDFLKKKKLDSLHELNFKERDNIKKEVLAEVSNQKMIYLERKEADREIRKIRTQIDRIEKEIESIELKIAQMNSDLNRGLTPENPDFFKEYDLLKIRIDELMKHWEVLQNELEILKGKRNSVI